MKKICKISEILISIILVGIIVIICTFDRVTLADVGSFETYDSGSSSSWDSDSSSSSSSSWGSGSYDFDDDYSYHSNHRSSSSGSSSFLESFIIVVIIIALALVINYMRNKKHGNINTNFNSAIVKSEQEIEADVKAVDANFNREEFLAWTRDLFIKFQEAWTKQDWSTIRVYETNQLFEQHKKQLQGYIDNNQINVLDRVCVLSANLISFSQSGDKDIISVRIKSKMVDYIIDSRTRNILKGDTTTDRYSTYKLTFIRKKGTKTVTGQTSVKTTNCPNCGAPTDITSSGKCKYCGSVLVTGNFGWVLADYTKIG